jgi:hypothetical protein
MNANLGFYIAKPLPLSGLPFLKQDQLANSVGQLVNLAFQASEIIVSHYWLQIKIS